MGLVTSLEHSLWPSSKDEGSAMGSHIDPGGQVQGYRTAANDEFSVSILGNWNSVGRESRLSSGMPALRAYRKHEMDSVGIKMKRKHEV